jgi:hypothetical protein
MESNTEARPGLLAAYVEVCRSYERIDDFRAKLLGFLPVVSGAGLFLLLGKDGIAEGACESSSLLAPAGIFGAIVTVGLLCYEERGIQRCVRLATVGRQLESRMMVEGRFHQWPHSVGRIINEPFASGLIYSAMLSAWIYVALTCTSSIGASAGAAVTFVVGVIATRAFYWWVTWSEESPQERTRTNNWWYRRFDQREKHRQATKGR